MYYFKRNYALDLENKLKRVEAIDKYNSNCHKELEEYYKTKQYEINTERDALEQQRKQYQCYYNKQEELLEDNRNHTQKLIEQKKQEFEAYCKQELQNIVIEKERYQIFQETQRKELEAERERKLNSVNIELKRIEELRGSYNHDYKMKKIELKKEQDIINSIISSKISTFPIIATMIADYTAKRDEYIAKTIEEIRPRAFKARDEVNKLKEEKKKLLAENLEYKWEIQNLYFLLPWLDEIKDEHLVPQETDCVNPTYNGKDDDAHYWLSQDEYDNLSTVEKYQRALDRYVKRRKSNAEIGKEYERYIGYLYECKGNTE